MNYLQTNHECGGRQRLAIVRQHGLALAIGMIMTILVLIVWQALIRYEDGQIHQLVQQEATAIQTQLDRELANRITALERMARRWTVSGGISRSLWESDATSYINDIPGYQAIAWVDAAFQPQWVIPTLGNAAGQRPTINQESRRHQTLQAARDTRKTTVSPALELAQGGTGFLACIPLFRDRLATPPNAASFDGFIVGVFRFDALFQALIGDTLHYTVEIRDATDILYRQGNFTVSPFTHSKTVTTYGSEWQIAVTPTPMLLQSGRSPLPTVVLFGGIGGAWIVALLIHLEQRSKRHVRSAQLSNQQLHAEVLHRQQVEDALAKELLRSQTLFNISLDGIVVMNDQGQVIRSSPSFAKMLGYSLEEMTTLSVIDWDAQWTPEELQIIIQDERPMPRFETRHRRKDGSIYDVEISYSKIKVEGVRMHFCICRDISDRKQAELELQHSQSRFAGILEIASDAIISVNTHQQITLFNKGAERIFGYSAAEIIGKPLNLLLPTRYTQQHTRHVQQYAQSSSQARPMSQRNAVFGRRKDGSEFPAEASISKLNLNGEITFTTFLRDITERQTAEAAMAHLAAIIEFSEDAIFSKTLDGIITSWNQGAEKIFGYTAAEMEGQPIATIIPEIDIATEVNIFEQIRQGNCIQHYDTQRIAKDGHLIDLSISISPIKDTQGKTIGASAIARDIRDRKQIEAARQQAEENLRHQKEILQVIINHIPVMLALFNAEGRIEFVNPEFERVLGWSLEEWQSRDVLRDCYPDPADYDAVITHMVAANGRWKDFSTCTKTQQIIETSWTNVGLSNGLKLGIGQDVSDRKHKEKALSQAVEAAESANLAKSLFLANMSHELRTPLNVILGFAQVMAHDPTLTLTQRDDLQTIQRSGDHLLNLINDVLDLSKIEAGHCVLEESGFDLIALLHTLRTMMTEHAKTKRIKLSFEIADDIPQYVFADEQKLRQVLLNLLSNAIKFTPKGSVSLHVKTLNSPSNSADPRTIQFTVVDTGVGINPGEQDSIFNAFVQAEAGKQSVSGTGLGLTISRKLLELMHGTITVNSTPNVGSTFTVQLPLKSTNSSTVRVETHDHTVIGLVPGQSHHRILVVDDQPENRLLMVRLLSQLGMEVREASSGDAAIRIWQDWKPDLTWMDIRMPGLDGYEATKQIRAMEQGQASVIIALTAQASHSDRALAIAAGCDDYISKPFREDTIFLKMREYLGLEYLYAESHLPMPPAPTEDPCLELELEQICQSLLADLPPSWLSQLEDAALCGNDRAIVALTAQLPPTVAPLPAYLIDLANKFQFEHILNWVNQAMMGEMDSDAD